MCRRYARYETPQVDIPRDPLRQEANLARTTVLPDNDQAFRFIVEKILAKESPQDTRTAKERKLLHSQMALS